MNTTIEARQSSSSIQVENLCVQFGQEAPVLDHLNLTIESGEIVALVGPSGCGKSTLLRCVASLLKSSALATVDGRIRFEGATTAPELAYVFQDATLLPWRTTEQNVQLPFELGSRRQELKSERASVTTRVHDTLRAVGLSDETWRRRPKELSGGMRMRTSLARALVTDPTILLLDEPFAALDDMLRTRMNELILDLWSQRRRTILFVTHNIAEAVYLSHRIAILNGGRVARILDNPLGWPRKGEQRTSAEFAEMYSLLSAALVATTED